MKTLKKISLIMLAVSLFFMGTDLRVQASSVDKQTSKDFFIS